MNSAQNWFVHDHSQYEEKLSSCKEAIKLEDWEKADAIFQELVTQLKLHITQEEEGVYPIYDALVKIPHDPTRTLRTEHDRIHCFMKDIKQFIKTHDSKHGLECVDRLEDLLIRHQDKEEDIFLPMAGYVLDFKFDDIKGKLGSSGLSVSTRTWDI